MTDYAIALPWPAPPLTLNQRLHFRKKAEVTKEVRDAAARLFAGVRMRRPAVTLVWLVTSRHRRDSDNLVPTLKALCDGLVDAGVARDDTPEFMHKSMPVIHYARGHVGAPGMYLVVWDASDQTSEELRAIEAALA